MAPASGIAMCHIGCCTKSPMTGAIHEREHLSRGRPAQSGQTWRSRYSGCTAWMLQDTSCFGGNFGAARCRSSFRICLAVRSAGRPASARVAGRARWPGHEVRLMHRPDHRRCVLCSSAGGPGLQVRPVSVRRIGLTPKAHPSGGRERLGRISKTGRLAPTPAVSRSNGTGQRAAPGQTGRPRAVADHVSVRGAGVISTPLTV